MPPHAEVRNHASCRRALRAAPLVACRQRLDRCVADSRLRVLGEPSEQLHDSRSELRAALLAKGRQTLGRRPARRRLLPSRPLRRELPHGEADARRGAVGPKLARRREECGFGEVVLEVGALHDLPGRGGASGVRGGGRGGLWMGGLKKRDGLNWVRGGDRTSQT